jgi:hypothetical protein
VIDGKDWEGKEWWPSMARQAMGEENYTTMMTGAGQIVNNATVGTANTVLFAGGVLQIIAGNVASGGNEMKYPDWAIPRQFDKNWNFMKKDSWLRTAESMSTEDKIDIMLNTTNAIITIFPFAQSTNKVVDFMKNTVISTTITETINTINEETKTPQSTQTKTQKQNKESSTPSLIDESFDFSKININFDFSKDTYK